jgi:hypothetical protein
MTPDPLVLVWQQYGWLGVLGYVMVREVWPFVREKVWPEKKRALRLEQERLEKLEDRQVAAVEKMGNAVQEMAVAIVTNNERLSVLVNGHAIHAHETTQAIVTLRERTAGYKERPKGKMI